MRCSSHHIHLLPCMCHHLKVVNHSFIKKKNFLIFFNNLLKTKSFNFFLCLIDTMSTSFFEFRSGCSCKTKKGHLLILPEFGHPPVSYESIYSHPAIKTQFNGWVMSYSNRSRTIFDLSKDLENFLKRTKIHNLHVLCHGSSHVLLKNIPEKTKIILINPTFKVPTHHNNIERARTMNLRIKRGFNQYVQNEYNMLANSVNKELYTLCETPCLVIFSKGLTDMNIVHYYSNIRIEELLIAENIITPNTVQNFITPIMNYI